MSDKAIAIIGCGNLGESILKGLLDADYYPNSKITITKRNLDSILPYSDKGVQVTSDNILAVKQADILVLALKPYTILNVLKSVKEVLDPAKHTIVSLAAGVTITEITALVGDSFSVYRAMPNISAAVNESMTCICSNGRRNSDFKAVQAVFESIGEQIVINEELMEAATVLGACGVAYVLRFIRAMVQGGIQIGFDAKTANSIVNQTVLGAAKLLLDTNQHPESEIDKVTTPKGCTIVGLNQMEHSGFSSALIKGINASFEKIQK